MQSAASFATVVHSTTKWGPMKRRDYLYVQAVVNRQTLDTLGSAAISFRHQVVSAESETAAYDAGQLWAEGLTAVEGDVLNDFVLPFAE